MEWAAIVRDLLIGLLIAGAIGAWVPSSFWSSFLPVRRPDVGDHLGSDHRSGRGNRKFRLLGGQRPARGGVVERGDQDVWYYNGGANQYFAAL